MRDLIDARFAELMQRYADDTLSAADGDEFNAMLRDDPAMRDAFVGYCLHARLAGETLGRVEAPTPVDASVVVDVDESKRYRWVAPLAIAAAVLIGAAIVGVVIVGLKPNQPTPPDEPRWTGAPVAVLTDSANVRWVDDIIATGDQLPPRPIRTRSGRVGIQFDSGASLATQGASEIVLTSATRCRLVSGVIAMQVPPSAHGFTVAAPGFDVVDLGTGFGLTTEADGSGQVHVFEGEVEVRLASGDVMLVRAGEAIRIIEGGTAIDRLTPAIFDYPIVADTAVDRWAEMTQRLTLDADLAALITMDAMPDEPTLLTDRGDTQRAVRVLGGAATAGRMWETKALHFTEPTHGVALDLPDLLDAFTLAMWVKLDRLPEDDGAIASLIQADTWGAGDAHWNLDSDGRVTMGINGGPLVRSERVIDEPAVGRWVHLAVTYDSATGAATLYMDGKRIAHGAGKGHIKPRLGATRIGNWTNNSRPLSASIDDVVVLKRAMEADEIAKLYGSSGSY